MYALEKSINALLRSVKTCLLGWPNYSISVATQETRPRRPLLPSAPRHTKFGKLAYPYGKTAGHAAECRAWLQVLTPIFARMLKAKLELWRSWDEEDTVLSIPLATRLSTQHVHSTYGLE